MREHVDGFQDEMRLAGLRQPAILAGHSTHPAHRAHGYRISVHQNHLRQDSATPRTDYGCRNWSRTGRVDGGRGGGA